MPHPGPQILTRKKRRLNTVAAGLFFYYSFLMECAHSTKRWRLLFVDDIQTVLLGLKRLLHPKRNEWDMVFANSAAEALALLEQEPFDIIISDVVMPSKDGVTLLMEVKERWPNMIRFILSGHADHQVVIRSVGAAHQFLAKPCKREVLEDAIARALNLRALLKNRDLLNVVRDATSIPTLPELYQDLKDVLASEDGTTQHVARVISKDITVSTKVLQLVNSAFFGLTQAVLDVSQAVALLGGETIHNIVLATSVFSQFTAEQTQQFRIREIYTHSMQVGEEARRLAKNAGLASHEVEKAMLAGMMHDIGLLALIDSRHTEWQALYLEIDEADPSFYAREHDILGISHAEVGAYLLSVWGLPNPIIEAVAFHHVEPAESAEETSLTSLLYRAHQLCIQQDPPQTPTAI